jgi:pimeloyl-ACP methyl ester carboxylesterase
MSDRPLVLLHGALGDSNQLAPLAARLGTARRITVLELEGHGKTPFRDRPLRIETLAESVIEAMSARGIERADFFGYSLGGYIALQVAAMRPERVERIATLATKFAWTPEISTRETAMLDPATIRAKVPKFAAALEARHTGAGWEALLAQTADLMRALGAQPVLGDAVLASIAKPVRVGVGDRDATVSIDESAWAARQLPKGELEVYPRTAHPFEKAPLDRIVRSLDEFLA